MTMEFDDQKIESLLGDVDVPNDLKGRLLEIPDQVSNEIRQQNGSVDRRGTSISILALAATVCGVALFVWSLLSSDVVDPPKVSSLKNEPNETETPMDVEVLLSQMEMNAELMEQVVRFSDRNQFADSRFREFDQAQRIDEDVSMIMGLSSQAALDQGASFDSVRSDLDQVVQRFPGTHGAELANRILNEKNSFQF